MTVFRRSVSALMMLVLALAVGAALAAPTDLHAQSADAGETPPTGAALETLLEVLKDEASRNALIADLEAAAGASAETASEPVEESVSLGRQIALVTQEAGENAVAALDTLWSSLQDGGSVFSGLSGDEFGILLSALPGLLAVIVITVSSFVVMRRLAKGVFSRLGRRAEKSGPLQSFGIFVGTNLTDALIVIAAWALGYLATLVALGDYGSMGIRQSLYLNAFLLVEMMKVVIRSVLSPIASGLRPVPVSDYAARKLTRYLSFVVSVLGYGQLLIVPIVNQSASRAAGNGVSAVLSALVLFYLFYVVSRQRKAVAAWLSEGARSHEDLGAELEAAPHPGQRDTGWFLRSLNALADIWHWFALTYLAVMFAIVMTQPADRTLAALTGSGKILGAVILATLVSGWIARAVQRGISLPEDINAKLPLLEQRINRFVPRAFGVLRLLLLLAVLFFSFDVLGLTDMRAWLESQMGIAVTGTIIAVSLILLVAFAAWIALTSFVDFKLNPEYGAVPTARETTLLTLMRNAASIALVILTAMFCLSEIGLDIGPLLASAGVLGLAIGFGAQKMVQDIITGVFIQFENAINVGDVITVGGITGGVEKLSVRSVSLRDLHGVFHIIPFSSVDMVSNFTRDFSYFVCDMGVAYRETVEDVRAAMHDAFDRLLEDTTIKPDVLGELEWFGVDSFGDSAVVLRARIKTRPGKQWSTGRAYNGYLKTIFDARGIEIPFPQQTIWFGEAKDGSTQPIRLSERGEEA